MGDRPDGRSDSVAGVLLEAALSLTGRLLVHCPTGASASGWPTCVRVARRASRVVEIGDDNQMGVFIPTGVAHSFRAHRL
ncbi:MAG: hypothetical protein R3A10_17450 [Caldilineaceae bacterium]